jgi:hypothetical protein
MYEEEVYEATTKLPSAALRQALWSAITSFLIAVEI